MSKKKEELSVDEIFYGMPKLRSYFKSREWKIRKYEKLEKVESAVKAWRDEKEVLLQAAQEMDIEDLRAVYYLHNIKKGKLYRIVGILRKLNDSLEELSNLPKEEEFKQ